MKLNTYNKQMLVHVYLKKINQSRDRSFGKLFKSKGAIKWTLKNYKKTIVGWERGIRMKITYKTLAQIVGSLYFGSDVEFRTVDDLIEFLESGDGYFIVNENWLII